MPKKSTTTTSTVAQKNPEPVVFKSKQGIPFTKSELTSMPFAEFKTYTTRQDTCKFYVFDTYSKIMYRDGVQACSLYKLSFIILFYIKNYYITVI